MKIKERWCVILIILYFFTYFNIRYEAVGERPKPYLYFRIYNNKFIIYNELDYFFHKDENIQKIEKIEISKTNIFGMKTILLEEKDLNILVRPEELKVVLIPFFIKEVSVKSTIEINNKTIEIEQKSVPTFEFGINPLWLIFFDVYRPKKLFKIGGA